MPLILDLCGGSGAWSKPYLDAGYDVQIIDPWVGGPNVLEYHPPDNVHGVLAAPPCTDFCLSGAQYWGLKDRRGITTKSVSVVSACLRIITECTNLQWWALENPKGRLPKFIGPPVMRFHPWHYGDPYTKETCLWGQFTAPTKRRVTPNPGNRTLSLSGSQWRERSVTPKGFAQCFFEANP